MTTAVLALAAVVLVVYLMRRPGRLKRER